MTILNIFALACLVIAVSAQGPTAGPPGGGGPGAGVLPQAMTYPPAGQIGRSGGGGAGMGRGTGGGPGGGRGAASRGLSLPALMLLSEGGGGGNMGRMALMSSLFGRGGGLGRAFGGGGGRGLFSGPFGLLAATGQAGDTVQQFSLCQMLGDPFMCMMMAGGM